MATWDGRNMNQFRTDWLPSRNPVRSVHHGQHPGESDGAEARQPGHAVGPRSEEGVHRPRVHRIGFAISRSSSQLALLY